MSWIEVLRKDVAETLNELGEQCGCLPLHWDLDSGIIGSTLNDDWSTAGKWAALLGLESRDAGKDGRIEYRGLVEGIPFTVSCQHDTAE